MLDGLPEPVRRYMNWTGVVGRPWIRTAYVNQSGRLSPTPPAATICRVAGQLGANVCIVSIMETSAT